MFLGGFFEWKLEPFLQLLDVIIIHGSAGNRLVWGSVAFTYLEHIEI